MSVFVWSHLSVTLTVSLRLQEAGWLPSSAGPRWLSPDERARLEVCVHLHPGVLPLPGGERPGQNQKTTIDSFCDWLWFKFLQLPHTCTQAEVIKIISCSFFNWIYTVCLWSVAVKEGIKYLMCLADTSCVRKCTMCSTCICLFVRRDLTVLSVDSWYLGSVHSTEITHLY